jgi:hypothetical protein
LITLSTSWFNVECGLRQGCPLSPLLFSLFINDLATKLNGLEKGVSISNELLCFLMYADDIVVLADQEEDLQILLNELNTWVEINCMKGNCKKSNVVHFRPKSKSISEVLFKCG